MGAIGRLCAILTALLCVSCGWLPGGEGFISSLETDYYLSGGTPSAFSGADAPDGELQDLARAALDAGGIYMGLYRHGGASSAEKHRIESGDAHISYNTIGCGPISDPNGSVTVTGARLSFSFTLVAPAEQYSQLQLSGSCALEPAQRAIEEVRSPKWGDNTSQTTTDIEWTLSGQRDGTAFSLSFTQTLTGRSDSYSEYI